MTLAAAIQRAQVGFDEFAIGTPQAPQEGTADWYTARARAAALSFLKRADQLALSEPAAFERFMRQCANTVKSTLPEELG